MSSLQDLLAQRAEIEKKIADAQREERSVAIAKVKTLMAEHGLTAADLTGKTPTVRAAAAPGPKAGGKVAPKFRNGATGETWSGRGLQPKWLKAALASGAKLEDFAITP
ncbi:H-NS histone family protein [Aquabacterium sp. OR-4]|uniref:H-NS histone family protein n=1 Tax=Aquabacterium sp. OR-4 TaxID=2978127 RepID=UPI0021B28A94|nr:H-NS histone family protein [Aquabacterium sp. OR-4]MDT7835408.1 H-NS histone family protein [Aquabacterium sp. OR-4]